MTERAEEVLSISYNLPPIRRFTGRRRDRDVFGIIEYIAQIEEHAGYTRKASANA